MTNFKKWLKKLGWVQTVIAGTVAIALVLLAAKVRNKRKSATKKDQRAADLIRSGVSSKIQKGKKLADSANVDKDATVEIQQRMELRIEQLGESNEDLDSVVSRFNSKRILRHRPRSSSA